MLLMIFTTKPNQLTTAQWGWKYFKKMINFKTKILLIKMALFWKTLHIPLGCFDCMPKMTIVINAKPYNFCHHFFNSFWTFLNSLGRCVCPVLCNASSWSESPPGVLSSRIVDDYELNTHSAQAHKKRDVVFGYLLKNDGENYRALHS